MAVRKIEGRWWVDFRWKNDRLRRCSPLNTKGGAEAYESHLRQLVAQHGSIAEARKAIAAAAPTTEVQPLTFGDYAEQWLGTYVRKNRGTEQRAKAHVVRVHLAPHLAHLALSSIRRVDIERYRLAKLDEGLSPKTVNNHLTILGKCLRTAQADEAIDHVPLIEWCTVRPPEFDFLQPTESLRLLRDRTEPGWTNLVRLAVRTGMRRGELIALDWSAVDLIHARVTVRQSRVEGVTEPPKNNRVRHIPLTEDVVAMLTALPRREGLVFPRADGGFLSIGVMRQGLLRLCRRAGLRPIGWHVLRHSFASQLAMEGVPLLTIKDLMGHSTIQMTMRYAHLAPSTLAAAVPVLLRAEARCAEEPWAASGQPQRPLAAGPFRSIEFSSSNLGSTERKSVPIGDASTLEPIPGVEP